MDAQFDCSCNIVNAALIVLLTDSVFRSLYERLSSQRSMKRLDMAKYEESRKKFHEADMGCWTVGLLSKGLLRGVKGSESQTISILVCLLNSPST